LLLCSAALFVHAGLTYRDYFDRWGPSAATFDAFEGDMAAAWQWLGKNEPVGHVFLSSDIYRHPTFTLLHEQASVQTIFSYNDPGLSLFEARAALPLPPRGASATYLLASSSPPAEVAARFLSSAGADRDRIAGPDGAAALIVIDVASADPKALPVDPLPAPVLFTGRLSLVAARWQVASGDAPMLWLRWQTGGPDMADWPGYRLEVAAGDRLAATHFDAFRPTEWIPNGSFLTWHSLDLPDPSTNLRLRLVHADGTPVISTQAPDGWHAVTLR
jgi:hypothetical protein